MTAAQYRAIFRDTYDHDERTAVRFTADDDSDRDEIENRAWSAFEAACYAANVDPESEDPTLHRITRITAARIA